MTSDPFQAFKATQRENWKTFAPLAMTTTPSAAKLVHFAGVRPNQKVLDVGCGTGVVAITARRAGATVTGIDLTPELLAVAKENAVIAEFDDITWKEGDAENLPFRDGEFDVVLSQFAHIFAPRPDVAIKEMLTFDRGTQVTPALSPQHYRHLLEQTGGPMVRLMKTLKEDPARLAQFRREYDELVGQYFEGNLVRQDFLMTRATKA